MNVLPQNTVLGAMQMEEVFIHFDFPRLFLCRNKVGQRYLGLSVEDGDNELEFVFVAVSPWRLNALIRQDLDLQSAITHAEEGVVLRVGRSIYRDSSSVDIINVSQVPDDWLPDNDVYLETEGTLEDFEDLSDVDSASAGSNREIVNLGFDLADRRDHEIPARVLSSLLGTFQELIDAIGQSCKGEATLRGAIPGEILRQTRLNVAGSFKSSFGVQIRAQNLSDIFGETLLRDALGELANLLGTEADEDRISNKLHQLRGRVASKYKNLLQELGSSSAGVHVRWRSPSPDSHADITLTRETINAALKIVNMIDLQMAEEVEVPGTLYGLNVRTGVFELWSLDEKEKYTGKLADEVPDRVSHATLQERYVATVRKFLEVQSASGEEKEKWVLVDLKAVAE
ncbi:DUF6575 domain-containing protein [Salicola sp. Rm-C-2C1-2]|uniref:DUF6575 domain-containing protein n=1 Tax=Salicola sp. Rm-C-2C1-2 TaxID=3141321 RepID=UPI0032E49033